MTYSNKNVSPIVKLVILYPEKEIDDSVYKEENEQAIVAQLQEDFQDKLELFDVTWEELDEIIMHYMSTMRD